MTQVAIIGAGIAGLTCYHACRAKGLDAEIFEQSPGPNEAGAAIFLGGNGMKVLHELGIDRELEGHGAQVASTHITDQRMRGITTFDYRRNIARGNEPPRIFHRARLQAQLLKGIPTARLHMDKRLQQVSQDAEGVRLLFSDGTQALAGVVVGADGIHSSVRKQLFANIETVYCGQTCWRGVTSADVALPGTGSMQEAWGDDSTRFGSGPLGAGQKYWYAVAETAPAPASRTVDTQALAKRFAAYTPEVAALIAATPDHQACRHGVNTLSRVAPRVHGRVALIGDAAHGFTPNLGQGGSQAIEDAGVLAKMLATNPGNPVGALKAYAIARAYRPAMIRYASSFWGVVSHWQRPLARGVRDWLLRSTPAWVRNIMVEVLFASPKTDR